MKSCENCSAEIYTKDGENLCRKCEDCEGNSLQLRRRRTSQNRKEREQILRDCGLVKVKGIRGGTYWE